MRIYRPKRKDENGRRVVYNRWYVDFYDHKRVRRRVPGFHDRRTTEALGRKLEQLVATRSSGDALSDDLVKWIESLSPTLCKKFMSFGLLTGQRAAVNKSLDEHLDDFFRDLRAKDNTIQHCTETKAKTKCIFDLCDFRHWSDISASRV